MNTVAKGTNVYPPSAFSGSVQSGWIHLRHPPKAV